MPKYGPTASQVIEGSEPPSLDPTKPPLPLTLYRESPSVVMLCWTLATQLRMQIIPRYLDADCRGLLVKQQCHAAAKQVILGLCDVVAGEPNGGAGILEAVFKGSQSLHPPTKSIN
jgi:hypothetical protein